MPQVPRGFARCVAAVAGELEAIRDVVFVSAQPPTDAARLDIAGPVAAILLKYILHYFFTSLMLKVHINIGRLIACSGDKPFKQ